MPIRRGAFGGTVKLLPIVTMLPITNYSAYAATFSAGVSNFGSSYDITFQISTNQTTWNTANTITGSTSLTPYVNNTTSIGEGTTYYVRAIVTNSLGSTTSNVVSVTSWSLRTFIQTTAGPFSVTIPAFTPVGGGAPQAPSIHEMIIFGGGGGANYAGGGGGGYRINHVHISNVTCAQVVSGNVGAGGVGGSGSTGNGGAAPGLSSVLIIGSSTYTAGGGGAGSHPGVSGSPSGTGGSSGGGSDANSVSTIKAGGSNTYGYTYINGYNQWTDISCGCATTDKFGNCTAYNTCNNPSSPTYATDAGYYAGGGGGGTNSVGANAITQGSASHVGGAGGTGFGNYYGLRGGNGGGGRGTQGTGANGSVPAGTEPIVGTGGQGWYGAGVAGGVTFKYYGP